MSKTVDQGRQSKKEHRDPEIVAPRRCSEALKKSLFGCRGPVIVHRGAVAISDV